MDDTSITTIANKNTGGSSSSVIVRIASKYGVDSQKLLGTLKATVFKTEKPISDEQMLMLLVVAEQHNLNPLLRELFAYPDKNNGIVPVVSIDGWSKIINEHPQFDGLEFKFADDCSSCTCIIYRRDRSHPISLTEYMAECKRGTQPWTSHPRRMLRHKAMIQCARIAFGFAGIYDPDEAERIAQVHNGEKPSAGLEAVRAAIAAPAPQAEQIDPESGEILSVEKPAAKARKGNGNDDKPPADAHSDGLEPGKSYAQYADALMNATSQDIADLTIDAAHVDLPPDQHNELMVIYRRKFNA